MTKNADKIMHFANFNITFGTTEEPMLAHFQDIIFPAFCANFKRGKVDEPPIFYMANVELKNLNDELVLVGNYIKDTRYDVHTTVQDGELRSTPTSVPTAPYSRFIIFLKNHRMILVRNESHSPDIRSFQATVRSMINDYIKKQNAEIQGKEDKLPRAFVNIVEMPLPKDIEEVLKGVSKIDWVKIRFFPLNNDINPIPIAENIDKEMKKLGCKRSHLQFTSPASRDEVKALIKESSGLACSTLAVVDENGNKTKIKEDQFTSSTRLSFARDIRDEDDGYIIEQAKKHGVIDTVSEANRKLYNLLKDKIGELSRR